MVNEFASPQCKKKVLQGKKNSPALRMGLRPIPLTICLAAGLTQAAN